MTPRAFCRGIVVPTKTDGGSLLFVLRVLTQDTFIRNKSKNKLNKQKSLVSYFFISHFPTINERTGDYTSDKISVVIDHTHTIVRNKDRAWF